MQLNSLGRTGIQVSTVGLGVMTFGAKTGESDAFRQLDRAFESGINLFDTAENYPAPVLPASQGRSEEILGHWVKARSLRQRVVIATKVAGPGNAAGDMTHIRGADRCLDRANILAAVDSSLKRLNTDYIDLYQLHWPERAISTQGRSRYSYIPDAPSQVPLEETLEALSEVVRAGKVRHVGVANETPWGVMRYLAASQERGFPRIASIQNGYSLLDRQFEIGLAEIAMREQVGLIAYSPLARGLLTGKYLGTQGENVEGRARFSAKRIAASAAYVDLAKRHGLDPQGMALAFVRQKPFVTSVLTAASTLEQLEDNLRSLAVTLPKEVLKDIDALHDEMPYPR
jgi:aryl-alcohol dehydrogenase-like predicted oxidoreductase